MVGGGAPFPPGMATGTFINYHLPPKIGYAPSALAKGRPHVAPGPGEFPKRKVSHMSQIHPLGALLSPHALAQVKRTGVSRLDLGGVRLVPFRAALGLLISSVRRKPAQKGSRREVERKTEGSRRRGVAPATAAGHYGRGGHRHG